MGNKADWVKHQYTLREEFISKCCQVEARLDAVEAETGGATLFTEDSVLFVGAGGAYTEDNDHFTYDPGLLVFSVGDLNASANSTTFVLDDDAQTIDLTNAGGVTTSNSATTNIKATTAINVDTDEIVALGDVSAIGNSTTLTITDSNQTIDLVNVGGITTSDSSRAIINAAVTIDLDTVGLVSIGDVSAAGNGAKIVVDDPNNEVTVITDNMGVGTVAPAASAKLDVVSTVGGLGVPSMTAVQASALPTTRNGLIVHVTDTDATFTTAGFWGLTGGAWEQLTN